MKPHDLLCSRNAREENGSLADLQLAERAQWKIKQAPPVRVINHGTRRILRCN